MNQLTERQQNALSLVMRWYRNGGMASVERNQPWDVMRWSSDFNEWQGDNTASRWYFNDPDNQNSKQYLEIKREGSRALLVWHSDHRLKRDQKAVVAKMQAAYEAAKIELAAAFNAMLESA